MLLLTNFDQVLRIRSDEAYSPKCLEEEFSEVRLPLAPRSCAIGFLCRRSQAYRCVHKKHNTPRNTTTPPAILWPLGRGYAELRHYGVLRSSLPAVATWHAKRSYDGDIAAVAHSPSSVFLLIRLPRTGLDPVWWTPESLEAKPPRRESTCPRVPGFVTQRS